MVALFRDGCDPLTGAPLGRGYAGRRVRPVVGFDLTFTIPKSASVLWALGDARTRSAVIDAHHAAVTGALRFVEHSVVRTRVGAGGRRQVRTRGMLAAGFDHWDSRAGDPNLHTHVVLANKVQGPDQQWRALDGTDHPRRHGDGLRALRRAAGRRAAPPPGRDLVPPAPGDGRNEAFEIDGLDDRLLAAFSSRSERIHEAELDWTHQFQATHGRGPSRVETIKARGHLTRATRPAKVIRPLTDLFAEWANRARALTGAEPVDLAARALAGDYARALHAHDIGPQVRHAVIAQVLADVSARRSVWSTWNLGAAAARVTKPLRMASARQRQTLIDQVTRGAAGGCVQLDEGRDPATRRIGEALFTTVELLGAERVLLDAAASTDFPHPLRGWEADALARDPHLAGLTAGPVGRRPGDPDLDPPPGRAGRAGRHREDHHPDRPHPHRPTARAGRDRPGALRVGRPHPARRRSVSRPRPPPSGCTKPAGPGAAARAGGPRPAAARPARRGAALARAGGRQPADVRACAPPRTPGGSPGPGRHRRRGLPGRHPHPGHPGPARRPGRRPDRPGRRPPATRPGRGRRGVRDARPPRPDRRADHPAPLHEPVGGPRQPRAAPRPTPRPGRLRRRTARSPTGTWTS